MQVLIFAGWIRDASMWVTSLLFHNLLICRQEFAVKGQGIIHTCDRIASADGYNQSRGPAPAPVGSAEDLRQRSNLTIH